LFISPYPDALIRPVIFAIVIGIIGFLLSRLLDNITGRKRAEGKHQTIVRAALDGFWVSDLGGRLLEVNDSYCKMIGYTREELLTMSIPDIEAAENPEATAQHIKNIMEQGYDRFETRHKRKDGKIIDVEVSVNYLDVAGGQMFVFVRDVTERKRVEKQLRESEEKLRLMFESVSDGITVSDQNGIITGANNRVAEIHGFGTKDEVLGKSALELIAPCDHERAMANMQKTLQQGSVRGLEYTLLKADGSDFPGELSASVLKDASGNPVGFIAITRDITERKQAEQAVQEKNEQLDTQNEELQSQRQELMGKTRELEMASRAKSDFLSSMSHELRTPLNAVIGFSELMIDGIPGEINDEQKQCLGDIWNSGQHLLNLINDVLDLSKVEAGKMELRLRDLNLADAINDAAQTVKLMLDKNRHQLAVNIEEGLPQVRADKSRLRQVVLNLLSNAINATPPGGEIAIDVSREGDWCQVSVVDNGIGIKKDDQENIFEAFTQVETLPDRRKEGTGLGLTLTKQFVEAIGGRIWLESEYGKGSKFTFTLPLAKEGKPYLERG